MTNDHDCVAPATVSHSGRSTFQFLKVDLESLSTEAKGTRTKLECQKGRHQSDISPSDFFYSGVCLSKTVVVETLRQKITKELFIHHLPLQLF